MPKPDIFTTEMDMRSPVGELQASRGHEVAIREELMTENLRHHGTLEEEGNFKSSVTLVVTKR